MPNRKNQSKGTAEIEAISAVYTALNNLEPDVQARVLRYSAEMLGLESHPVKTDQAISETHSIAEDSQAGTQPSTTLPNASPSEDAEGINSVALKWIKRSGLDPKNLQKLFSLGIDEIDLVAKSVPGKAKKERMHNVLLLKGIAAYLSTGVPRINYDQLKETLLHYNAYDVNNQATYLKDLSAEIGGSKEGGYTLTARGLTTGTELVKKMLSDNS